MSAQSFLGRPAAPGHGALKVLQWGHRKQLCVAGCSNQGRQQCGQLQCCEMGALQPVFAGRDAGEQVFSPAMLLLNVDSAAAQGLWLGVLLSSPCTADINPTWSVG